MENGAWTALNCGQYFGQVKAAGSNLLFAVVTEVSDSVLKGAETSGFDGLVKITMTFWWSEYLFPLGLFQEIALEAILICLLVVASILYNVIIL